RSGFATDMLAIVLNDHVHVDFQCLRLLSRRRFLDVPNINAPMAKVFVQRGLADTQILSDFINTEFPL
ncbi:MAG: hypothetical protein AB8B97_26840, partial [Granulosicoccus sp.]